tara:strand:+ start:1872 stop:2243 length:372 start_codon:yes stop_codon:yes gene_type:complete
MPRGSKKKLNHELLKRLVDKVLFEAKFNNKDKLYLKDIIDEVSPLYRSGAAYTTQRSTSRPARLYDIQNEIRPIVVNLVKSFGWERKHEHITTWEYFEGLPCKRVKKYVYFIRGKDNGINQYE